MLEELLVELSNPDKVENGVLRVCLILYRYSALTINVMFSCAANRVWRRDGHSFVEPIVVGALKALWRLYVYTDTPSISRTITPHTPSVWRALKQDRTLLLFHCPVGPCFTPVPGGFLWVGSGPGWLGVA